MIKEIRDCFTEAEAAEASAFDTEIKEFEQFMNDDSIEFINETLTEAEFFKVIR